MTAIHLYCCHCNPEKTDSKSGAAFSNRSSSSPISNSYRLSRQSKKETLSFSDIELSLGDGEFPAFNNRSVQTLCNESILSFTTQKNSTIVLHRRAVTLERLSSGKCFDIFARLIPLIFHRFRSICLTLKVAFSNLTHDVSVAVYCKGRPPVAVPNIQHQDSLQMTHGSMHYNP